MNSLRVLIQGEQGEEIFSGEIQNDVPNKRLSDLMFYYWMDFGGKAGMFTSVTVYAILFLSWTTCKSIDNCQLTNDPTYAVTIHTFQQSIAYWMLWNYRLASISISAFMFTQAAQVFTNYRTPFPLSKLFFTSPSSSA